VATHWPDTPTYHANPVSLNDLREGLELARNETPDQKFARHEHMQVGLGAGSGGGACARADTSPAGAPCPACWPAQLQPSMLLQTSRLRPLRLPHGEGGGGRLRRAAAGQLSTAVHACPASNPTARPFLHCAQAQGALGSTALFHFEEVHVLDLEPEEGDEDGVQDFTVNITARLPRVPVGPPSALVAAGRDRMPANMRASANERCITRAGATGRLCDRPSRG
jgi:hypothetical protein